MTDLLTINNPFLTVDDFHQRAGKRLASLIHRLASKYPQLPKRCGARRMLLALSVAWALTGLAKDGNQAAFEHIDEALSPAILRELSTEKARRVMEGLQDLGVLDAHLQPVNLSWSERGYLAQQIAYKLGIEHQWKTFGELWHCDAVSLRSGYNRAKEMPKMADFEEKIKKIVG